MSPDTVSTLFPDRPIRPLPKRRLRERLSPEVADSIKYPASTLNSVPLFQYPPYSLKDDDSVPRTGATSPTETGFHNETARNYTPRRNGTAAAGEDDHGVAARSTLVTRPSPEILSRGGSRAARPDQTRQSEHQPPPSAPSSVDGYDSFENTNNKKKRKIPSAGDAALGGGTYGLNADMGSHSLPGVTPLISGVHGDKSNPNGAGHGNSESLGAGSPGFSGSGRGRLGRSMNGRTPLRTLSDGNNTWAGRAGKGSAPHWAPSDYEGSGIISSAIANAEKLPPQGQENVSLLQQHSSGNKGNPASTQFTFTCDPQVPGTLQWPGHAARNMGAHPSSLASQGNPSRSHDGSSKANSRGSKSSRKENRRRLEKELNMAARQRQQMAAEQYFNNPPKLDDIWICEFCEYERIFGEPPRALIREYELKDRRARQEEADRKRLLEKAKAKGRKAKKNVKGASKGGNATNQQLEQQPPDVSPDVPPENQDNSHSTQSENEEEEGFIDDYPDELANTSSQGNPSLRADEGGGESSPYRTLPT